MVLTSHPFPLSVSPSNVFAANGTFMTWKRVARSKSHFYGGTFYSLLHFYGRTFLNPKMHKHEETRKKDEENTKDTRNLAYFSSNEGENHRAKTAR